MKTFNIRMSSKLSEKISEMTSTGLSKPMILQCAIIQAKNNDEEKILMSPKGGREPAKFKLSEDVMLIFKSISDKRSERVRNAIEKMHKELKKNGYIKFHAPRK